MNAAKNNSIQVFIYTIPFISSCYNKLELPSTQNKTNLTDSTDSTSSSDESITESLFKNVSIDESELSDCIDFAKDLSKNISKEGLKGWVCTWSYGAVQKRTVGVKVTETDVQRLIDVINIMGARYQLRGKLEDQFILNLPQEKYNSIEAAIIRLETWMEHEVKKRSSSIPNRSHEDLNAVAEVQRKILPIATLLAKRFWKMAECDLVNMELVDDSREDFFLIDMHSAVVSRTSRSNSLIEEVNISSFGKSLTEIKPDAISVVTK